MAVINKNGGYMALPISIRRGNPIPLDESSIWYSLDEMKTYAETSATAYVGQILSLVDEENAKATAYIITDTTGTLVEIGTGGTGNLAGDNKSMTITDEGVALKDFGEKYYKYIPAVEADEEAGIEAQEAHYELTEGWIDGLEPKVHDGELAWYQPNPTTVQGLQSQIGTLQTTVDGVKERVDALSSATSVRGTVDSLDSVTNPQNGDIYFVGDKEYIYAKTDDGSEGKFVELGSSTDLSAYKTDTENAEIYETKENVSAISERVSTIEALDLSANVGKITVLEQIVGQEEKDGAAATGLVGKVAALEAVEPGDKNTIESISAGDTALTPVNKNVSIPIFSGTVAGLVKGATDVSDKDNSFLNANGNWSIPKDNRIGTLTFNDNTYDTVTEYIDARMNDISIEWETIS